MTIAIPEAEYRSRLSALGAAVAAAGLDLFAVSAFDSIFYLTGAGFEPLERPFFLLVSPSNRRPPALLVPKLDERHMGKAHGVDEVHAYWDHPSPPGRGWPERLDALLGDARRVGVEPDLPVGHRARLRTEGRELVCEPLVERLRVVKSPAEVAMIRRSARYADRGVTELLGASYRGATVAEGFARTSAVTRAIIRDTPDWDPVTTRVLMATWAAPRSAQPHGIPALTDRLDEGPHVALVLSRVNGYSAESERTYFTVPPNAEVRDAFAAMTEARRRAFAAIRPGAACGAIDAAVREFLEGEGLGGDDRRLHRTGHGIGLGTHEAPFLAEGGDETLAENMVVSVEPGVYLEGVGGFRHSDTVLVGPDGPVRLTDLPDGLEDLTLGGLRAQARLRGRLVRRALGLADRPAA